MGKTKTKPPAKPAAKPKARPVSGADAPTPPRAPQPPGLVAPPLPPVEYRGTLPLARLRPSPTNPRKTFDPASVAELAASIGSLGLLQPLLVRPVGPAPKLGPKGWEGVEWFEVVAGARRLRALELNGAAEAAVTCRLLTDAEVAWVQLVENDQREDVRPSERAAAYAALAAAGQTAEQISAATGVALSAVRDLVRLARLPAWALAAVDAGTLPTTTAALVAKVPGEESRRTAAATVLFGAFNPREVQAEDLADLDAGKSLVDLSVDQPALSFRDTKEMLATHFTRQLKGSPFSLKVIDQPPGTPSCDACPKRAGNDPEAKAEGVRADVCLDPDCYRAKVEAYRAAETEKAAAKGAIPVPDEFVWGTGFTDAPRAPKGWCLLDAPAAGTELGTDFPPGKAPPLTLAKVLGKDSPQQYLAFYRDKPRLLVKTAESRRALQAGGVLKKPERKPAPKAERPGPTFPEVKAAADTIAAAGKPLVSKVAEWEADERAAVIAAGVLREYAEDQCAALAELPDAVDAGPIRGALVLVSRAFVYDVAQNVNSYDAASVGDVLKARFPAADFSGLSRSAADKVIDPALEQMAAPQLLALLLQLAAAMELGSGPNRETGKAMLDWAELDWPGLTDQARRVLAGGESAEEKLAGVEAQEAAPLAPGDPPPVPLADLDIPDVVLDLLGFLADQTVAGAWAGCLAGTEGLDALPPRNRLMAWLVKLGAKAKPADQAAEVLAAALPADAGKAGAA